MMVSAKIATWVPIEPSVAGPDGPEERTDVFIELERRKARQAAMTREIAAPAGNIAGSPTPGHPRPRHGRRSETQAASASVAIIERLRKIEAAEALA